MPLLAADLRQRLHGSRQREQRQREQGAVMIEVRDLSKRYGPTVAVDGLSFDVLPGRVTGFLGPNGAGKSTTMRMILGLDAPTSGSATVNGRAYQDIKRPAHEMGALLDRSEERRVGKEG